mmetsp:Transcript_29670/g.50006  ORF Transcript_29670/g.50006 Transcript_29670/m.50006 type:complete len:288 (+) Transcript_29670:549-1412(+)
MAARPSLSAYSSRTSWNTYESRDPANVRSDSGSSSLSAVEAAALPASASEGLRGSHREKAATNEGGSNTSKAPPRGHGVTNKSPALTSIEGAPAPLACLPFLAPKTSPFLKYWSSSCAVTAYANTRAAASSSFSSSSSSSPACLESSSASWRLRNMNPCARTRGTHVAAVATPSGAPSTGLRMEGVCRRTLTPPPPPSPSFSAGLVLARERRRPRVSKRSLYAFVSCSIKWGSGSGGPPTLGPGKRISLALRSEWRRSTSAWNWRAAVAVLSSESSSVLRWCGRRSR